MKLNVRAFALTCGIIWGVGLFLLTWWIILFEGATGEPTLIGLVYRGFTVSPRQYHRLLLGDGRWLDRGSNIRMVL